MGSSEVTNIKETAMDVRRMLGISILAGLVALPFGFSPEGGQAEDQSQ